MKTPTLKQNKNGNYEVRWSEAGRSRVRSLGTSDHAEAIKAYAAWLTKDKDDKAAQADPTVKMALDRYFEEHVEQSVVAYERQVICANHLLKEFGEMRPRDVGATESLRYANARRKQVGNGTIRRELGMLRAAIKYCIRSGYLSADSLRHMIIPPSAEPKSLFLNQGQLNRVLQVCDTVIKNRRLTAFVTIAAFTAARRRSIETLEWSRVDLANKVIDFHDGSPKTKKRKVKVPMNDNLHRFLVMHKATSDGETEFVLDSDTPIHFLFQRLKQALIEAYPLESGVWEAMTPHTLRHTWATLAAQSGVSMFDIAGVLGDTIQTVSRVYAHQCPDHLRKAVSFLGANPDTTSGPSQT